MADALRTSIIMDYQNVHLTGHGLYESTRHLPRHETLVDPLLFAQQLLRERNAHQRPGNALAVLSRVLVFRGHPSSEHDPDGYARNLAQKSRWTRDSRVHVTLRPLKYRYQKDAAGHLAHDIHGKRILAGPPQEKGVDVLCALATVREARDDAIDLVILASSDTDLAPALDEVQRLGCAKVETCCWYCVKKRMGYQLHPSDKSRRLWNAPLRGGVPRILGPGRLSLKAAIAAIQK